MKPAAIKHQRCAIYTRISTDNGLEQEFNSLHAQREAAQAYIKSQGHEGSGGMTPVLSCEVIGAPSPLSRIRLASGFGFGDDWHRQGLCEFRHNPPPGLPDCDVDCRDLDDRSTPAVRCAQISLKNPVFRRARYA
jgi:hypothetical protein